MRLTPNFSKSLLLSSLLTVLSLVTTHVHAESTNIQTPVIDEIFVLVNDTPILFSQVQEAIDETVQQLQLNNQPVPPKSELIPQVLDQVIIKQIQLDFIKRIGLKVDENQVNNALLSLAKKNGFNTLTELQKNIDAEKAGNYRRLRQQVIDTLSIQLLQQQQLTRRVRISEQDIDLFLKSPESNVLKQNQYHTLHIRVPYKNMLQGVVNDKQKQQALEVAQRIIQELNVENSDIKQVMEIAQVGYEPQIQGGDMGFHATQNLPTDVAKHILALKVGEVSQPIITSDGIDIIKLVAKQDNEQHIIDQWSVRHILVSPSITRTPEMAKQHIDNLYEQLRQGADFATLAATYSDDTGSASKGGSLDWVNEGDMVPQFEAMMKSTNINDYSIPFQSQFGWHILKVEGKRKQDVTNIYHKNLAREILYQRLAPQALEDWLQELKAQSYIHIQK